MAPLPDSKITQAVQRLVTMIASPYTSAILRCDLEVVIKAALAWEHLTNGGNHGQATIPSK